MIAKLLRWCCNVLIFAAKRSSRTDGTSIGFNDLPIALSVAPSYTLQTHSKYTIDRYAELISDGVYLDDIKESHLRAVCWVQKVCHLEDTLEFYRENFGLKVSHHEEYSASSSSEDPHDFDGGTYSKTTLVSEEVDTSDSFSIELLYYYGVNRYRRGNDLRGMVFRSSKFTGNLKLLDEDSFGQRFLETPDGHLIIIVDDARNEVTVYPDVESTTAKTQRNALQLISLHVADLPASVMFYKEVFCANVDIDSEECSAICTWNKLVKNSKNRIDNERFCLMNSSCTDPEHFCESRLQDSSTGIGIELVQLPPDESMDIQASQGLFVIEAQHEIILEKIKNLSKKAKLSGFHYGERKFPLKLSSRPGSPKGVKIGEMDDKHTREDEDNILINTGKEEIIITDPDGHKFLFIHSRKDVIVETVNEGKFDKNIIDWAYRKRLIDKASNFNKDIFGENIIVLNSLLYTDIVENSVSDVLIDFYAPWCSICVENKPVYQELARRVKQLNGEKLLFAVLDGSTIPMTSVKNDELSAMLRWTKQEGYPALFYVRADDKRNPIEFDGEWTIEGLTSFILENSSHLLLEPSLMEIEEPSDFTNENN